MDDRSQELFSGDTGSSGLSMKEERNKALGNWRSLYCSIAMGDLRGPDNGGARLQALPIPHPSLLAEHIGHPPPVFEIALWRKREWCAPRTGEDRGWDPVGRLSRLMNWKLRLSVANAGTLTDAQSQQELGRFGRYSWTPHFLIGPSPPFSGSWSRQHPSGHASWSSVGGQTCSAP